MAKPVVTAGMLNGDRKLAAPKTMATIVKILNPLLVNLSSKKNTMLAINVGAMLEMITGTMVSGLFPSIKMVSTKIPALFKMKNKTVFTTTAAAAAIKPAVIDCLKDNLAFMLFVFTLFVCTNI